MDYFVVLRFGDSSEKREFTSIVTATGHYLKECSKAFNDLTKGEGSIRISLQDENSTLQTLFLDSTL